MTKYHFHFEWFGFDYGKNAPIIPFALYIFTRPLFLNVTIFNFKFTVGWRLGRK